MTTSEALTLVRESVPYKASGTLEGAWFRWRAANHREAVLLLEHADALIRGQAHAAPVLSTKFGRGFVALLLATSDGLGQPSPAPDAPSFWDQRFAIVVTAGNCDADLVRTAGFDAVAFELNPANLTELSMPKWHSLLHGAFYAVRSTTEAGLLVEAAGAALHLVANSQLAFLVVDTEILKADHPNEDRFALQDVFYRELRRLAPLGEIANLTYGWHQDGNVVNYKALRDHQIEAWFEAYDGDDASWDVRAVVEKLNAAGFLPARVALGDKHLALQTPTWKMLRAQGKVRGVMVWGVDNGPPQDALRAGVRFT